MGLELHSENHTAEIAQADEIIFSLFGELGVTGTFWMRIRDSFWDDPQITSVGLAQSLLDEISNLRHARIDHIMKERKVSARTPRARNAIRDQISTIDPVVCKIDEIVTVLKDAIATTGVIKCLSD